MYVCMYVCIYICICIYIYICIYIIYIHTCTYVYIHAYKYISTHVNKQSISTAETVQIYIYRIYTHHIHTWLCTCVPSHICMTGHMRTYAHKNVHSQVMLKFMHKVIVKVLENITTEPHAHYNIYIYIYQRLYINTYQRWSNISVDIVRVWLSGYILQQKELYLTHMYT